MIEDFNQDLADLFAICQRPSHFLTAYALTSSEIPSLNKRWTGHMQLRHNLIWRKCHHLSPGNESLLVSVLSPPVLTISDSKGNNSKHINIVQQHMEAEAPPPLRMIVSGTAGTGKTYLIHCIQLLLGDRVCVAAPTGVAAFNIDGHTLHSLLSLPTKGVYKDLEGEHLHHMQQSLVGMCYLIINEMSMVVRIIFGQIDKCLCQVFPRHADQLFLGCSCLLFGDFGQLPPVMDLPLYTTVSRSALSE